MKNNNKKMLKTVIISSLASLLMLSSAFAIDLGVTTKNPDIPSDVNNAISTVLSAAQWIGLVVGVGMIIYIGVKYLTAGAGKKAEAKETAIPLLIGAGLVMLAPTVANWVFGLFKGQ